MLPMLQEIRQLQLSNGMGKKLATISYTSNAARNLPTAFVKGKGKETWHYVLTVIENNPRKKMTNCHLWNLLGLIAGRFNRNSKQ